MSDAIESANSREGAAGGGSDARDARLETLYGAVQGLQRLAAVFQRRRHQLARQAGLTDAQWRLLEEISDEHFMPSLFARRRACSPAAVSRTLRQLQERKLVEVSISRRDARQREYALSPLGRRVLGRLRANRERALETVWRDLPSDEIERFGRFSGLLADRLERYAEAAEAAEAPPEAE